MDKVQDCSITEVVLECIRNGASPEEIQVEDISLPDYMNYLLGRRDIPLSILAELVGINRATLYKILSGNTNPSRNLMIRFGLELQISYHEMQMLLKLSSCAALSGTRRRDIFIINAIENRQSIGMLEDLLKKHNLESILTR